MTDQRTYGGRSAHERRLDRRARLIGAALEAMAGNDWRTVTVDKLCAAAGLNKRYFYENFTDLDSLAAAVVDDIADRYDVRVLDLTVATQIVLGDFLASDGFHPSIAGQRAVYEAVATALGDEPLLAAPA